MVGMVPAVERKLPRVVRFRLGDEIGSGAWRSLLANSIVADIHWSVRRETSLTVLNFSGLQRGFVQRAITAACTLWIWIGRLLRSSR